LAEAAGGGSRAAEVESGGLPEKLRRAADELNRLVVEAVNAGLVVSINRVDTASMGKVEHHIVQVSVRKPI
jgi:hypothetical protein